MPQNPPLPVGFPHFPPHPLGVFPGKTGLPRSLPATRVSIQPSNNRAPCRLAVPEKIFALLACSFFRPPHQQARHADHAARPDRRDGQPALPLRFFDLESVRFFTHRNCSSLLRNLFDVSKNGTMIPLQIAKEYCRIGRKNALCIVRTDNAQGLIHFYASCCAWRRR